MSTVPLPLRTALRVLPVAKLPVRNSDRADIGDTGGAGDRRYRTRLPLNVTVSVALLFAVLGSTVPDGTLTLAVFVIELAAPVVYITLTPLGIDAPRG